jgi:MFS family permease
MFKPLEHYCSNCLNIAMTHERSTPRPLGATFWRIWSAQTVSTLGSAVAGIGIAVHVFLDSGNALWLGLLMAAAGLPFVVLAPLLGRIDRFDRRTVMIAGDSIAALGTLTALAFALGGQLRAWHLVIAAVIGGIGTAIQMPAAQAAVPSLVDDDQLDRANGFAQIGPAGGIVAAPVIATMLVSQWGVTAVLVVDAVTFAVAVAVTALTPFGHRPDRRTLEHDADGADGDQPDSDAAAIGWAPVFDWMRRSGRGVAVLLVLMATVNLCLGFFNVALVALVATIDERWAGLPLAVGGVAMLAAGILVGRRGLAERRMPAVTSGMLLLAVGCAVCGLRPSLVVVAVGTAIALAGVPVLSSASTTLLHERVPAAMLGRMFALRGGIGRALDPLGAIVAGIVISAVAEPAMSPDGALHRSAGRVLDTGDGRGAALVMILVGGALTVLAIMARSNASLRHLDAPRPVRDVAQAEVERTAPAEAVAWPVDRVVS